jgi:polysaccharide biosynthesis/export protein
LNLLTYICFLLDSITMSKTSTIFFLLVSVFLTSCISTKSLTYLQQDESRLSSDFTLTKKPDPYRIQINDLLSIRIKSLDQSQVGMFNPVGDQNPNATGEERLYYDGFRVNEHGNIRIPTLGELNVLGYTEDEIREMLEKKLLDEFLTEQANIFITVKLAGIRYTIMGEIGSPGSNIIYRDELSIMEAIANSGDITLTGDRKNVVIVRQYPYGQRVHHIDLTTIEAVNSPYYYVNPNDLILINPLPQKSIGTGTTAIQSITTIASILSLITTTILLINRF